MYRKLSLPFVLALLAGFALPASSQAVARGASVCPGAHTLGTPASASTAIVCLLNQQRALHGLPPLRPNNRLAAAAARHSRDMAARNYFSHSTPGGGSFVTRIRAARYLGAATNWSVGENLGWGTGELSTPASIVVAWMRSPGHRANVLKAEFREVGVGVTVAGGRGIYTADFGSRG